MTVELHLRIVTLEPERVKQWRCFHCDEVFTDRKLAADHFGDTEHESPGCLVEKVEERGLLSALRRAQRELALFYADDSHSHRAIQSIDVKWRTKMLEVEQQGYDKGLADIHRIKSLLGVSHRMLALFSGRDVAANFVAVYGTRWIDEVRNHIARIGLEFGK